MAEDSMEIARELRLFPPFGRLPPSALEAVARKMEVQYARRGTRVIARGDQVSHLFWIRSGAVELRGSDESLELRLEEGESCGYRSILSGQPAASTVTAIEDTLLYRLPAAEFRTLIQAHPSFARYFDDAMAERLKAAREALSQRDRTTSSLFTTRVSELASRSPVAAEVGMSVREAAARMTEERVSCLPVMRGEALVGIVTDRDLRSRVLGPGVSPDVSIEQIMTPDPLTLPMESSGFEALLAMTRLGIHHLPLLENERLAGVVTATDLIRRERANPVYIVGDIRKATDVEEVARAARSRERVFLDLVDSDTPPEKVGTILAGISDAVTRRLIELVVENRGEAPAQWSWLVFGSQAREESGVHSDQDHGILVEQPQSRSTVPPGETQQPLADTGLEPGMDRWFSKAAEFVSDGLRRAGYPFCPGKVMATESRWRRGLEGWEARFRGWIVRPVPEALLHAGIFFDFRQPYENPSWDGAARLRREILQETKGNEIFVAHLVTSTLGRSPPLGIFRRLVLERDGEGVEVLDLKHRGVIPIVDLVRAYALEAGVEAVGTRERVRALAERNVLSRDGAANLLEAFDFISFVRLRHQARRLREGKEADSLVPAKELSPLESRHIRDVFQVVRTHRDLFARRLQTGLLG